VTKQSCQQLSSCPYSWGPCLAECVSGWSVEICGWIWPELLVVCGELEMQMRCVGPWWS
jgi:hypothetical protein